MKNPVLIRIIMVTAILCFASISIAADHPELEKLRDSFMTAKKRVNNEEQRKEVINNYIQQLTDLAADLRIYKHDISGANAVRKEIRNARAERDLDPADRAATAKASVAPPVVVKPPEPVKPAVVAAPEPAVVEELIVKKPAEIPVTAKPEPKPVVTEPLPEPIVAKPEPAPVVAKPEPKPVAAKPEPAPVVAKPEPKPDVPKPEPKPVVAKPEPKTVVATPVPKPVIAKAVPKPVVAKPEPKPVVAKPVAKPVVAKPVPKPVIAKPVPKPVEANPAPTPVASKPEPKPEVKPAQNKELKGEHTPETYVSTVQGLAGSPELSKDNVYTFNLTGIGPSTTLAFWATGRNSIDTYGKVWLTTPEGRRVIAGIWKESYFETSSTEIYSYYKLNPITEDITKKVTGPGTYKIEFEWTYGKEPLVIYRVEITS